MTTFKDQLQTLKTNLPQINRLTIADFLRENYTEILEVIRLSRVPEIKATFHNKSAYGQISHMAFVAGVKQKNGKPLSESSISTYMTRIYKEKGITKKSGSNVKNIKTQIFTILIKYVNQFKDYDNLSDFDKEGFQLRLTKAVEKFESEVMKLNDFNQICLNSKNTNSRIDKRYKLSIIDLAKLLIYFKYDYFKLPTMLDNMKKRAL